MSSVGEREDLRIGDEVDITFNKSIITGVRRWGGQCAITVLTADVEFTFDVDAADTHVTRTGVVHDLRRCPECGHQLTLCMHRDTYADDGGAQPGTG